jgi:hypothetical protein
MLYDFFWVIHSIYSLNGKSQNTLSVPSSCLPAYEDGTESSEMLVFKLQIPVNHPEESIPDAV